MTYQEQRNVAQKACFYFDVYFGQNTGDSVVVTGDGVDDLDRLISRMSTESVRDAKFLCDVSMSNDSQYRPCDLEDVQAIRAHYVSFYGESDKPDAYLPHRASAVTGGVRA